MDVKKKGFIIYGKVLGKVSKKGITSLTVEALDKDLLFDDRLGTAITNKDGNFEILYDKEDFQELFLDLKPDIYLRVKNPKGEIIYTTEDKIKYGVIGVEEFNIVISEKLIEKIEVESERLQFKKLTDINPNYFGNIIDKKLAIQYLPVYEMTNNVKYEELVCVGSYPEDNILMAIIEVKLPYGYKGSLCKAGSKEYVGFYIDYNDGVGFVSVGAITEVNVHDISFVDGGHLFYAVRKSFIPKDYFKCNKSQIVKVRAILSWEQLPTGPNFEPVWGNVVDTWIQIKPIYPIFYSIPQFKLLPEVEIKPIGLIPSVEKFVIAGDKEEIIELINKSIEAEKRIKEEGKVEVERLEFKKMIMKNPNYFGSITESTDKNKIFRVIRHLPPDTIKILLPKLTIDPNMLVPVKFYILKTMYEELKCIGLYPNGDLLEAVIEIKLPYGFNGDLCTLGSKEYVAFYIDWGSGYKHVATSTVGVHDIPVVNDKHLFYAVKAKIPNIKSKLKDCPIENIVKVKAILSWNEDPTPYGHIYKPTWGNVLIRNIQIRPKDGVSVKCDIEIVNEVHIDEISQSGINEGLAIKIDASNNAVPLIYDRPFGGIIACWGNINVWGAAFYRFRYSNDEGDTWKNITDERKARNTFPLLPVITRTPDSNGWFSKSEYDTDIDNYSLAPLVHWRSYGKDNKYLLKLELADAEKNPLPGQTTDVSLILDNREPELFTFGGTPPPTLPTKGVTVKDSEGNYKKCDAFIGNKDWEVSLIFIYGNFRDDYFKKFRLKIFGGNISESGEQIGEEVRYDDPIPGVDEQGIIGAIDGGLGQEIGNLNLCPDKIKCAYGIELTIWDRSIVGSVRGYEFNTYNHGKDAFVTFDWDPKGC